MWGVGVEAATRHLPPHRISRGPVLITQPRATHLCFPLREGFDDRSWTPPPYCTLIDRLASRLSFCTARDILFIHGSFGPCWTGAMAGQRAGCHRLGSCAMPERQKVRGKKNARSLRVLASPFAPRYSMCLFSARAACARRF